MLVCSFALTCDGHIALQGGGAMLQVSVAYPGEENKWRKLTSEMTTPMVLAEPATVQLGAKNGVSPATYKFRIATTAATGGKYSSVMVKQCQLYGMKPVCDHPSYCRNDRAALYIGQSHHIANPSHRRT